MKSDFPARTDPKMNNKSLRRNKRNPKRVFHCLAIVLLAGSSSLAQGIDLSEEYSYDGFTEPAKDVLVSALEIGRLESVLVNVGDRVKVGQVLATLEDSLQVIGVEVAKQQLEMKGEVDSATAEYQLHVNRTAQLRSLAARGTARPDELLRAETDLQLAEAKLLTAREQQVGRELEWKRQVVQLERRRVVSPLDGVVVRVMRQPGEYVSPSDASIVRVIDKQSLIAIFNLPASDAFHIRVGQVIPIRPRTTTGVIEGKIESIAPAIDGESGTVAIRLRIDNKDELLFPGDRCIMANVRQLGQIGEDGSATSRSGTIER
jgi:RND family efflux transporter MFP subunit